MFGPTPTIGMRGNHASAFAEHRHAVEPGRILGVEHRREALHDHLRREGEEHRRHHGAIAKRRKSLSAKSSAAAMQTPTAALRVT
jgi:hypothetical protein